MSLRINLVAYIQIMGGLSLAYYASICLVNEFSLGVFLSLVLLSVLSLVAGCRLLADKQSGHLLTYINQLIQVPVVYSGWLIYEYYSLVSLQVVIDNNKQFNVTSYLGSDISLFVGRVSVDTEVGLNIIPLIIVFILRKQ